MSQRMYEKGIRIIVGILVIVMLTGVGCSKEEQKVSTKKESLPTGTGTALPASTPEVLYKPVVEKGNIYVKREANKWQGVYSGKEKTHKSLAVTFYLHRVTEQEIWFSIDESDYTYNYIRGTKKEENCYKFYEEGYSFSEGDLIFDGDIEGEIIFKKNSILLSIWYDGDTETKFYYILKEKNEENADTADSVIELARCLNKSYAKVKKEISPVKPSAFKMGKQQGTDKISYIEISVDRDAKLDKNLSYFQIKGVGIWCSKEECKKILGTPTEEHTYDLRYRTEDGYEICFTFYKEHVEKMGIYLGSKKEALGKEK